MATASSATNADGSSFTYFEVKEKAPKTNKTVSRLLGVSGSSITCNDVTTKKVLKVWPFTTLRRWAATPTTFTLDFGDYADSYYSVLTSEGAAISQLVGRYIDIVLKRQKDAELKITESDSDVEAAELAVLGVNITAGRAASSNVMQSRGDQAGNANVVGSSVVRSSAQRGSTGGSQSLPRSQSAAVHAGVAAPAKVRALQWSTDDVTAWLESIDLANLQAKFRSDGINGRALASLTPGDFVELGVVGIGPRRILQTELGKLFPAPAANSVQPYAMVPDAPKPPPKWFIPRDQITISDYLGNGSFGGVFRALFRGTTVAVKKANPQLTDAQKADLLQEAELMQAMPGHTHVLHFYGATVDEEGIAIVMELCDGGSLDAYIKKRSDLAVSARIALLRETAAGMSHLEALGYAHRDLALRNVLLRTNGDRVVAVVADFGLARELQTVARNQTLSATALVPFLWSAPEVLGSRKYSTKSDVWSFGVLAWELFSNGARPYGNADMSQVVDLIVTKRKTLERPTLCPANVWSAVALCFAFEPSARPTFAMIEQTFSTIR